MTIMLIYFLVYTALGAIITVIIVPSMYALLEYSVTRIWNWEFFWGVTCGSFALFEIALVISILLAYFTGGLTI